MRKTIPNYKNRSIVNEPMDNATREVIKRIQAGYYKALRNGEGIYMPRGTVYVLDGVVYRLTPKGWHYVEIIRKKDRLTHWIKDRIESEDWGALELIYGPYTPSALEHEFK